MVASTKMKVDTKLAKSEGFIFCFNSYQPRNSRNIYEYRMQRITIFVRTFWCKNFKNRFGITRDIAKKQGVFFLDHPVLEQHTHQNSELYQKCTIISQIRCTIMHRQEKSNAQTL